MGYDDGFRMICVYLCVTADGSGFRDGADDFAKRKSDAIGQFGSKRLVAKVFAAWMVIMRD